MLEDERAKAPDFDVHADNEETVDVWMALQTQWRYAGGLGGSARIGLDYAAVPAVLGLMNVPRARRDRVFVGLRLMEGAALKAMSEQRAAEE